jgi:DNA-directed RNA polymerase specialized sigma24 family protein
MSGLINWIGAQADESDSGDAMRQPITPQEKQRSADETSAESASMPELPAHDSPAEIPLEDDAEAESGEDPNRDPDLWLYRRKTTGLLRRYVQWAPEAGRVPSLLGRELFTSKISTYTATTFEERVVFLHDVELCLGRLQEFDRQIVTRIVLQEYDHEAAARILRCDRKTIERRLPELIDELSEAFLKADLLDRLPETAEEVL